MPTSSSTPQQVANAAIAPALAPDWDKIGHDIHCPLCQYNLRGISEPRCPECGYRFDWSELLDPNNNHPYLFEQARRGYVKSFVKTLTRNRVPGEFWKSLRPSMRPNRARLTVYWFICAVLGGMPAILALAFPTLQSLWNSIFLPKKMPVIWPTPGSWGQDLEWILDENRQLFVLVGFGMAAYPLLSVGALMLFHESMRRARVLPEHVIRVGIYSADAIVWNGLWMLLGIFAWSVQWPFNPLTVFEIGVGATIMFTTFRIVAAYRHYMRFPDPVATAVLSQFVVFLTLLVLWIPLLSEIILNR